MSSQHPPDQIFYGGAIISMDTKCPYPEAVAIQGDTIVALGTKEHVFKLAEENTKYVELKANQALLPGLIEAHTHACRMVLMKCQYVSCSAYYYRSYNEIKALFQRTLAEKEKGQWCVFMGWDVEMLRDLPKLNFDILDEYSTNIPMVVIGQSGHVAWANRKAFEAANIPDDIENPKGGIFVRDSETNKLTGQMFERPALMMLLDKVPTPSSEELSAALDKQWMEYSKAGFTTVTDLAYTPRKEIAKLIEKKARSTDCPQLRVGLYQRDMGPIPGNEPCAKKSRVDFSPVEENDKLWFAGIKLFADGSPHCGTAAVHEKYLDNELTKTLGFPAPPCYGSLNYDREYLLERVRFWDEKDIQVAIHAQGERTIEQALSVLEEVQRDSPNKHVKHRLEHVCLAEEKHIQHAAKLDVSFSFFVQHLYFYATSYKENIFGPERTNRFAPLKLAVQHNTLWTIHQDHPTFPGPPEPFANLMTAVTRTERYKPETVYGPEYCISVEEALKGYTINAAKQIHKDKELGSLTVGKRADLVILSDNPLKVDPFKLVDIQVLDTYIDGRSNGITDRKESSQDGKLVYSYSQSSSL